VITIQRKTSSISASGGVTEAWETIAARRAASMLPVRGDERFDTAQTVALEQIEFRIRYAADVADLSPQDRIIYPALGADSPQETPAGRAIHDVLAVLEIGRREGLQIFTQRRADVTE
jgi:head-tail adaptor